MVKKSFLGLGAHGFHRIVYFEWGDPRNEHVLVCVHGLTRRGRDFDYLARALEDRFRVVCVDLPGRGASDWLPVAADYQPATYVADLAALIARLDVPQVDWLGVSLGGLIGMMLAAQPKSPLKRLILDDIGAFIGLEALQRIASYVGQDSGSPISPNSKPICAQSIRGTARSQRNTGGTSSSTDRGGTRRRAAGGSTTIQKSSRRSRPAFRTRWSCGRFGGRLRARFSSCAEQAPIS